MVAWGGRGRATGAMPQDAPWCQVTSGQSFRVVPISMRMDSLVILLLIKDRPANESTIHYTIGRAMRLFPKPSLEQKWRRGAEISKYVKNVKIAGGSTFHDMLVRCMM